MLIFLWLHTMKLTAQTQDTTESTFLIGPTHSLLGNIHLFINFSDVLKSRYNMVERLYKEGKYSESLQRSTLYLSKTTNIEFGRAIRKKYRPKFHELIALNEIALDNLPAADSAIRELLKDDIDFVVSDNVNDDLFEQMLSSYSINPSFSLGIIGTKMTPFFRNVSIISIHEDFDYSGSFQSSNSGFGFGGFLFYNWNHFSVGNELGWNSIQIERTVAHKSGIYQSKLNETSKFLNSKISLLRNFTMPISIIRNNKIRNKISIGPSITLMKLSSSDGVINSDLPRYSKNVESSSLFISSDSEINTTRIDLMENRRKYNFATGIEGKFWFYFLHNYWMFSASYQFALKDYTSDRKSLDTDVMLTTLYVDAPCRLSYFQLGLAYYKPLKPRISSAIRYE